MFSPGYDKVREWAGVRRASQRDQMRQIEAKYDRLLSLARQAADNMAHTQRNARLAAEIVELVAAETRR